MMRMRSTHWVRWVLKPIVFTACVCPLASLLWELLADNLGANPIRAITLETGTWTLRFLVLTLAITPLRRLSRWGDAIRLRRMLGLFAFFYGTLHFTTYIWLDQFFEVPGIVTDVMKRPFITVGFSAFLGLLPLALTSTAGWIRRLGGRHWQRLHRLIYASALGGVLHYWWSVKADVQRPQIYATLIGLLLLFRLAVAYRRRTPRPVRSTVPSAELMRRVP